MMPLASLFILAMACASHQEVHEEASTAAYATSLRTGQVIPGVVVHSSSGGFRLEAPGFLPRQVSYSTSRIYRLWPSDALMPPEFTFEGIHGSKLTQPLLRWPTNVVTVEPSMDLIADAPAWSALQFAIASINRVHLRGELSFKLVPPGSGGKLTVYRDTEDYQWAMPGYEHAGAVTRMYFTKGIITKTQMIFLDFQKIFPGGHIRKAMLHEFGHAAGIIGHPPGISGIAPDGVMSSQLETMQAFTAPEVDLLRWVIQRPANTRWPDNSLPSSSGVSAMTHEPEEELTLCKFPIPRP